MVGTKGMKLAEVSCLHTGFQRHHEANFVA